MAASEGEVDRLTRARRAAEAVVADMTEGDLRSAAFEIAFRHLLASADEPAQPKRKARSPRTRKQVASDGSKSRAKRSRSSGGAQTQVRALLDDGFFSKDHDLNEIVEELRRTGHIFTQQEVNTPLRRLTKSRVLSRREEPRADGKTRWVYRKAS
jgi:hypothetical protein